MRTNRNAAAIVSDRHRLIAVQRHIDVVCMSAESLIGGIVNGFLNDVRGIARAGIHAGQTLNRLDTT
jgi:hypothetical protein